MIPKSLFEHFNEIGHSYEGSIEGGEYAISEPIIVAQNAYGCSETFLAVENLNISTEYFALAESTSTDVKANKDGTYTVVDAKNDNDKNIYVVDENGKRTGEVIGETTRSYDFMNTDDGTGKFTTPVAATIDLKNLTVSGKINGTDEIITNADRQALLEWGKQFFINYVINTDSGWKFTGSYGGLRFLRELSGNNAPLDIKASLNLNKYTPVSAGKTLNGKPKITTLRAIGNELFGANMRLMIPPIAELTPNLFYKPVMKKVGEYNQSQNNGNGYNAG